MGFTGFYWVLLGYTVSYGISSSFIGFYWVSLGFIGFYRVLLGFAKFNCVLPGSTVFHFASPVMYQLGSYLVLLGLTRLPVFLSLHQSFLSIDSALTGLSPDPTRVLPSFT